jgi:predicted PolB exonuclease-like 3'-5' exonuclease
VNRNRKASLKGEWNSSEKAILKEFYDFLKNKLETEKTLMLFGFNTLRFDLPLLACRISFNEIDGATNVLENFRKIYAIDLRQCLLPFNKYRFKGLSSDEVARRFGIEPPKHSNKDIKTFYEREDYEKIEEHSLSDMRILSDLSWNMRELENIAKAFDSEV